MSTIKNKLEDIKKLSNSSLTSVIDVTNLNFKNLAAANLSFLNNIAYDESTNSFTVKKGTFTYVDINDSLSLKVDGVTTFKIDSLGKAEGQELRVVVSEAKRRRFTNFNDYPEVGVPGEIIYTGIQNNNPNFGEDFIGFLAGRGWVSLTNLTAPVNDVKLLYEVGSPIVLPTPAQGTSQLWVGPPGLQNAYEPVGTSIYLTDDDNNTFDILTNHVWRKDGDNAYFKLSGKAVIGNITSPGGLQFIDGNQTAGHILQSDGQGNASWVPPTVLSGAPNFAYWEISSFTADVTKTITHNLSTTNIVLDFIDTVTNERVEGHADNYTPDTVDVTLTDTKAAVKVVVLAAGGIDTEGSTYIFEVKYTELIGLINADGLNEGSKYLLTDFVTTYIQPVSNEAMVSDEIEPLILEAASSNTLHFKAISTLYPQDIIYYDVNDASYGATKGRIIRRIDTSKNVSVGTDWRHIKYRRWNFDLNSISMWQYNITYNVGDIVKYDAGDRSAIAISLIPNNEDDPYDNTGTWLKLYDNFYDIAKYNSISPTEFNIYINGSMYTIAALSEDYEDFYIFSDFDEIYNISIDDETMFNSIFKGSCYDNKIANTFLNNTIINNFYGNSIGNEFENNFILHIDDKGEVSDISQNIIENLVKFNTILELSGVTFHNDCSENIIQIESDYSVELYHTNSSSSLSYKYTDEFGDTIIVNI